MKIITRVLLRIAVYVLSFGYVFGQFAMSPSSTLQRRPPQPAHPLTDGEKQLILQLHNQARSEVQPTASYMRRMVWSMELEQSARQYAVACTFRHSDNRRHSRYPWVGENLYIRRGARDVVRAMRRWIDERAFYDLRNDYCRAGEMCGHYTQMVWAETSEVGCAIHLCPRLFRPGRRGSPVWNNAYNLVCHYGVGGNVRGIRPYVAGPSCQRCPGSCDNMKLCLA